MNNRAIILLSGGLDSVVSIAQAKSNGLDFVLALTFDYGQKSFKIYAGDSLVQVSVTKGGKHLGDYYVYLRDYIPRCVWYYKATI